MGRAHFISFLIAVLTVSLGVAVEAADKKPVKFGTVRVEVAADGQPVEGARVSASGVAAKTDASGVATLQHVQAGTLKVAADKADYRAATARVELPADGSITVKLVIVKATPGNVPVHTARTDRPLEEQAVGVTMIDHSQVDTATLQSPNAIAPLFSQTDALGLVSTSPVMQTTMARIQGLPGRYTQLLSDGVHLYGERPTGMALLRIPMLGVDSVELVKGPVGAFYGSDAPAGSINMLSRLAGTGANREVLFSQSFEGGTDAMLWLAKPRTAKWSQAYLVGGHYQDERDTDGDGWSDFPGVKRGIVSPRVSWDNGRGRSVTGVANVTFEKREGGASFAREALETKVADGSLSGQMLLKHGYVFAGAAALYVQSRVHDFSDVREHERFEVGTMELELRRPTAHNVWVAGILTDWYALRAPDHLPSGYVSTRPGMFIHDDWNPAPWLVLSGSGRLDHHNLYHFLVSPRGSALVRHGEWSARVTGAQSYFTPRPIMEETEAAGLTRLTIADQLSRETARGVSADFMHTTRSTALTVTLFKSQVDNPGMIDRTTYTLRTETQPIGANGVEVIGALRPGVLSFTGMYAYAHTRELDGRALPLTPAHRAGLTVAARGRRGQVGVQMLYTGVQRLDDNPYRTTSESYVLTSLLAEFKVGTSRLFVNADNLTNVRQTNWDPIGRPSQDVDGRWAVDAWAPLQGRVINVGLRIAF